MGFLSGFKAKFKTNVKRPKQSVAAGGVVCVRFKTFSEFDSPANYSRNDGPSTSQYKRPAVKLPQLTPSFNKPNLRSNGFLPNGAPKLHQLEKPEDTQRRASTPPPLPPTLPPRLEEPSSEFSSFRLNTSNAEFENIYQEYHSEPNRSDNVSEKSSSSDEEEEEKIQKPNYTFGSEEDENNDDDDDDEGNFKIHVANHPNPSYYDNTSAEELSDQSESEDEEVYEFKPGMSQFTYSSQAASIFFGDGDEEEEEEEITIETPRKIAMQDDDVSYGSSASA